MIRKAVRSGVKIFKDATKVGAPFKSGEGRRKIRVRSSKGPRGSRPRNTIAMALLVGEAHKKGQKGGTWYMWLQERGYHMGRRLRQGGKVIGYQPLPTHQQVRKIPGLRFAKKAMRAKEAQVKNHITSEILAGIEREASKG